MQEKNIWWRGHCRAVLGLCFATEAFQTWTECHKRNDVFPRLQAASNYRLGPVTGPAPSGCWSHQLKSPRACSWISIDHVTSEVFAVLAEIGGIPSSPWPWSAVAIGTMSIWTRPTRHIAEAASGRWEHGQEPEHQSWSERWHVFALSSAVIVTFNHEDILFSGKVHVVQAGDFAADRRRQISAGEQGWRSEFTPCTWATCEQRTWPSAPIALAV